jgi:hypothetical protein
MAAGKWKLLSVFAGSPPSWKYVTTAKDSSQSRSAGRPYLRHFSDWTLVFFAQTDTDRRSDPVTFTLLALCYVG